MTPRPDEVNVSGDQDADNNVPAQYPAGADTPTPQNIRRYPELFTDEQKAEVGYEESPPDDDDDRNGNSGRVVFG